MARETRGVGDGVFAFNDWPEGFACASFDLPLLIRTARFSPPEDTCTQDPKRYENLYIAALHCRWWCAGVRRLPAFLLLPAAALRRHCYNYTGKAGTALCTRYRVLQELINFC